MKNKPRGTVSVPNIPKLMRNIEDVLKRAWLTQGDWNKQFELLVMSTEETKYAVSCSSGTTALDLIFRTIPKGTIVVPANTHFATAAAVLNAGHKLWLADVSKDHIMLDLEQLEKCAPPEDTVAVCFVSIGGWIPNDIFAIEKYCEEKGWKLVLDNAHAHGTKVVNEEGRMVAAGSIGYASEFSYYPTKVVFGAEGGAITHSSKELDGELRKLRDIGRTIDWVDQYSMLGVNGRLNNVNAAICAHVHSYLPYMIEARSKLANQYTEIVKGNPRTGVKPIICEGNSPNWYKYTLLIDNEDKIDALQEKLKDKNLSLQTPVFEFGLHTQPYLKDCPNWLNKDGDFLNTTLVTKHHACLPLVAPYDAVLAANALEALTGWLHDLG